jgi:hypothetical protein
MKFGIKLEDAKSWPNHGAKATGISEGYPPEAIEKVRLSDLQTSKRAVSGLIASDRNGFPDIDWFTEEVVHRIPVDSKQLRWLDIHSESFLLFEGHSNWVFVSIQKRKYILSGALSKIQESAETSCCYRGFLTVLF